MKNAIEWFARNSVAANLLMVLILGGGILLVSRIRMEVFQVFGDIINMSMSVTRGAAPERTKERAVAYHFEDRRGRSRRPLDGAILSNGRIARTGGVECTHRTRGRGCYIAAETCV